MIENLLIMIGGLALFMYAITLLRETLGKISGKRVAKILEKTTDSPVKGMGVGTAATLMTQSSSITVLTLIGFVNAGMMTFRQSVHVMLGSEIGTTITAQLVSFKIGIGFAWLLIAIGFFTTMFLKNENAKMVGRVIFSLGLLFLSMDFMKNGASELGQSQFFVDMIIAFGVIPIFGILIGAAIAGITQSSSATTSLVIAMSMAGVIGLPAAIALIMGANIGTCFLENMAAIGATTPAKRTAIAQTIINIIGVAVFFPFFEQFADVVALTSNDLPRQIANAHTIFNVTVSFMLIPFVGLIVKLCEKLIPDKEGEIIGTHYFDDEMLHIPQVALLEAQREMIATGELTVKMIDLSRKALLHRDLEAAKKVIRYEDKVDDSCRATEKFIDKIREEELNKADALWRMKLLAILVDIERVGDLTSNIAEFAIDRLTAEISFSAAAVIDMEDMFKLVEETYDTSIDALRTRNKDVAERAILLEDKVDELERELREGHEKRSAAGVCMPQADSVFVETLRNLERVSDHADNIAADVQMKY